METEPSTKTWDGLLLAYGSWTNSVYQMHKLHKVHIIYLRVVYNGEAYEDLCIWSKKGFF